MNLSVLYTVLDNDEKSQIGKWKRDSFGVFGLFLNNVYLSYMHKYASYCFASQCTFNEEKLLWSLIFSLIFIIKSEVHIHRKNNPKRD